MYKNRVRNNLRYFAYWQRLKEASSTATTGDIFAEYKNKGVFHCNKKTLRGFELFNQTDDRMQNKHRVITRPQPDNFVPGDRLLFIGNTDFTKDVALREDQILRVESFIDKTNRGERVEIDCSGGAFVGPAPVDQQSLKSIIFKGAVASLSDLDDVATTALSLFNTGFDIDFLVSNNSLHWLLEDTSRRVPVVISLNPNLPAPAVVVDGTDEQMVHHPTTNGLNIYFGGGLTRENTQIYLKKV